MSTGLPAGEYKLSVAYDAEKRPVVVKAEPTAADAPELTYEQASQFNYETPFFSGPAIRFSIGKVAYAVLPPAIQHMTVYDDPTRGRCITLRLHGGMQFDFDGEMAEGIGNFALQQGYIRPN